MTFPSLPTSSGFPFLYTATNGTGAKANKTCGPSSCSWCAGAGAGAGGGGGGAATAGDDCVWVNVSIYMWWFFFSIIKLIHFYLNF